ncbi:hypothetical protein BD289DRAFT_275910 [Coniella lustricola]|uniref:DDE Tnp4 domain-containing protein n=1 Tax=Coniella lustricola TaxID=2025994 RepID=A0A2T3A6M2_9PEZI|nr:hypothetical protein BD289DRAFT_275910 [Coniella lustricola]
MKILVSSLRLLWSLRAANLVVGLGPASWALNCCISLPLPLARPGWANTARRFAPTPRTCRCQRGRVHMRVEGRFGIVNTIKHIRSIKRTLITPKMKMIMRLAELALPNNRISINLKLPLHIKQWQQRRCGAVRCAISLCVYMYLRTNVLNRQFFKSQTNFNLTCIFRQHTNNNEPKDVNKQRLEILYSEHLIHPKSEECMYKKIINKKSRSQGTSDPMHRHFP